MRIAFHHHRAIVQMRQQGGATLAAVLDEITLGDHLLLGPEELAQVREAHDALGRDAHLYVVLAAWDQVRAAASGGPPSAGFGHGARPSRRRIGRTSSASCPTAAPPHLSHAWDDRFVALSRRPGRRRAMRPSCPRPPPVQSSGKFGSLRSPGVALPPYVLAAVDELKSKLRAGGRMTSSTSASASPTAPSPAGAIDRLCSEARRPGNQRYMPSKGLPRNPARHP